MKKAFIISIPFYRIAKLTLSDYFLDQISSKDVDILIITPLHPSAFKNQLIQYKNLKFIKWETPSFNIVERKIFALSELFRRYGYLYKFRKQLLKYLYYNQEYDFGVNGHDTRRGLLFRMAIRLANLVGYFEFSWKVLDVCSFKNQVFDYLDIFRIHYDELIFIQSSSWAEQDRILQKWVKNRGIMNIFLPYTTDQLWTNGYLFGNYDKIYIQGPVEYEFATSVHKIPEHKLVKFGSLWFRILDSVMKDNVGQKNTLKKRIMYAGVADEYYPKEAEFEILNLLEEAIISELIPDSVVIYRPYYRSLDEKNNIINKLANFSKIKTQWMDVGLNEIQSSNEVSLKNTLIQTVDDFSCIDLLIMSGLTSIALDVAYLSNCAVIANFIDQLDVLKRRNMAFLLNPDKSVIGLPGCLVVDSKPALLDATRYYLINKIEGSKQAKIISESWDYKNNYLIDFN